MKIYCLQFENQCKEDNDSDIDNDSNIDVLMIQIMVMKKTTKKSPVMKNQSDLEE